MSHCNSHEYMYARSDHHKSGAKMKLTPFTLRVPLENIVCHFHTFENNLGIKQKFTKYLKESCCLTSG